VAGCADTACEAGGTEAGALPAVCAEADHNPIPKPAHNQILRFFMNTQL